MRHSLSHCLLCGLVLLALALPGASVLADTPDASEDAYALEAQSLRAHFDVSLRPERSPPEIGTLHSWLVRVTDRAGDPVYPVALAVGGGMAGHGHGLPTQPQITAYLGDGTHRIEGVRFNMAGEWTLRIGIEYGGLRDIAELQFEIDF
ncbi:MAG: auxin-binding protein [Pseudomonadota bacterium]